jgi:hypothetical protein
MRRQPPTDPANSAGYGFALKCSAIFRLIATTDASTTQLQPRLPGYSLVGFRVDSLLTVQNTNGLAIQGAHLSLLHAKGEVISISTGYSPLLRLLLAHGWTSGVVSKNAAIWEGLLLVRGLDRPSLSWKRAALQQVLSNGPDPSPCDAL